MDFSTISQIKT